MDFKANAKRHFSRLRDLKGPILVPEWGEDADTPAEVYYKVVSEAERKIIKAAYSEHDDSSSVVLIQRALDSTGKPLFKMIERVMLENEFDPKVIDRVVTEMAEGSEAARKGIMPWGDETDLLSDDDLKNS